MVSSRVNIIKISIENGQKNPINNYYCRISGGKWTKKYTLIIIIAIIPWEFRQ
jgi:hypothetical protein